MKLEESIVLLALVMIGFIYYHYANLSLSGSIIATVFTVLAYILTLEIIEKIVKRRKK